MDAETISLMPPLGGPVAKAKEQAIRTLRASCVGGGNIQLPRQPYGEHVNIHVYTFRHEVKLC